MADELVFFFFFWFDFRRLDFCCFGFLNLMYVIRFFPFWVLYFWFDGFESGDWVISGPRVDVHRKYRIYTILGEKKKINFF
jgi:hypothetical protein